MDALNGPSPKPIVLIVDDEPLVRMTIADMLRLGGFDVQEVATGGQALAVLANGQAVAAVVSDIRMPVMDGVDSRIACARSIQRCPLSWYRARRALTLPGCRQERTTFTSRQNYAS
jgi:DNA-binding NtrC family response regulator